MSSATSTRAFHLGDILSITTGRLVSPRHMEGVYDILNYMTGDELFTHQLPRTSRECSPFLLEQHPALKDVDASGVNKENFRDWLASQVAIHGESLSVQPIPESAHAVKNPLAELIEMGAKNVIVCDTSEESARVVVDALKRSSVVDGNEEHLAAPVSPNP